MSLTSKEVIFLGNYADADTNEATSVVENPAVYAQTFGSANDPLRDHQLDVTFNDVDNDGEISTDNFVYGETMSYDAGGGPVTSHIDSLVVASLSVTYCDGTVSSYVNAVLFQDTTGNMFLTNSNFQGTDLNIPDTEIQSVNVTSVSGQNYVSLFHNNLMDFVCFAADTMILTKQGEVAVQNLKAGDLILTMDNGFQPLKWVGQRHVSVTSDALPMRITQGALGGGIPQRDLVVSPQHRVLLRGGALVGARDETEFLVAAKHLTGVDGIEPVLNCVEITYIHLLFRTHEIIFSESAATESMFTGAEALKTLSPFQRLEICMATPDLSVDPFAMAPARTFAKGRLRDRLVAQFRKYKETISWESKASQDAYCS